MSDLLSGLDTFDAMTDDLLGNGLDNIYVRKSDVTEALLNPTDEAIETLGRVLEDHCVTQPYDFETGKATGPMTCTSCQRTFGYEGDPECNMDEVVTHALRKGLAALAGGDDE